MSGKNEVSAEMFGEECWEGILGEWHLADVKNLIKSGKAITHWNSSTLPLPG